jgi:hypothetical protein
MVATQTIERSYDRYIFIYNALLALGLLLFLVRYKLELGSYFGSAKDYFDLAKWAVLVRDKWQVLVLSSLLFLLFSAVILGIRLTREMVPKLFSRTRQPQSLRQLRYRSIIPIQVGLDILLFLALAWFTDNIVAFALTLTCFYANSIASNIFVTMANAKKFLSDPVYYPAEDEHKDFILARRQCVQHYLFETWHVARNAIMVAACAFAFLLAIWPLAETPLHRAIPFLVLAGAMLWNEIIVWTWRTRLYRCIGAVDESQVLADARRLGEEK